MAVTAKVWTFTQLGGNNKTLRLEGYASPFGRPRKSPVLVEKFGQQVHTVRYIGTQVPSRHILGPKWDDFDIHGRWMTRYLLPAEANDIADEWVSFIQEGQRCRISWGNIVSYVGMVENIELARESEHEIAWKMHILVDERPELALAHTDERIDLTAKTEEFADIFATTFLRFANPQKNKTIPDWNPTILDTIGSLVSSLNTFGSSLLKISNQIDDFRSALSSELHRLLGAIRSVKYALLNVVDTVETTAIESVLFTRQASSDINYSLTISDMILARNEMLAFLNGMELDIEVQLQGRIKTSYVAKNGDDWEGIASLFYNDPTRANELRQANGIEYGELPEPGRTYSIPR